MKKFLFSLTSAATLLLMVDVKHTQAAQFEFRYGLSLSDAKGTLTIDPQVPESSNIVRGLTGIGEESISLDELANINSDENFYTFVFFEFEGRVFDTIFDGSNDVTRYDYIGNPVFYFDSGNLVGIDLDTESVDYSFGDCRRIPCSIEFGTFRDQIRKDTVTRFYEGTLLEVDEIFTETRTDFDRVETTPVNFTTIEPLPVNPNNPVASVPEPFSIFGLGALVAFSTGLKRKLNRS